MSCARGSVTTPPWLSKHELRWTALTEARLAVLDHRLASRMARFREVTAATVGARHGPHRPLALTQAISQLNASTGGGCQSDRGQPRSTRGLTSPRIAFTDSF
jgi:hypothetical protein